MSENPYAAAAPPERRSGEDKWRPPFRAWWPVACGAIAGLLLRLAYWAPAGDAYSAMLGSFILGAPLVVGAVTVYVAERHRRRSWLYYFLAPAIATAFFVLGTLLVLIEGWICAILIFPLFAGIGGLAGLLMGLVCRMTNWPRQTIVGSVALLPLIGGAFEHRIPSPDRVRTQERETYVDAPPAAVWRQLVDTRRIRPDEVDRAWMYRIGVPLPTEGAAEFRDGEHLRHITMGKGVHFDQVAVEWRENEAVTWSCRFARDSFPPHALDDHVRIGGQYFDLGATRYSLRPKGAGTVLKVEMQYRVSTHFNWYAGTIADLLVGNFADVIVHFYGRRAEHAIVQPPAASS